MWSVGRNSGWTKRGQTSRPVVGTEIQTRCNFKANLCDLSYLMGFACILFSYVVLASSYKRLVYGIIYTTVCLKIPVLSYTKIFFTLRHHQNQVQDHVQQTNQTNQLNKPRYKKAVFSGIWLQLTMVACYPEGVICRLPDAGQTMLNNNK